MWRINRKEYIFPTLIISGTSFKKDMQRNIIENTLFSPGVSFYRLSIKTFIHEQVINAIDFLKFLSRAFIQEFNRRISSISKTCKTHLTLLS